MPVLVVGCGSALPARWPSTPHRSALSGPGSWAPCHPAEATPRASSPRHQAVSEAGTLTRFGAQCYRTDAVPRLDSRLHHAMAGGEGWGLRPGDAWLWGRIGDNDRGRIAVHGWDRDWYLCRLCVLSQTRSLSRWPSQGMICTSLHGRRLGATIKVLGGIPRGNEVSHVRKYKHAVRRGVEGARVDECSLCSVGCGLATTKRFKVV